eukprot:TRINITY_DN11119_c0_g1_i5.p1 TRINITY_DN11119_c0_g1~~TRINITY_DN11119_c0_g1_i5.p1  ORF type:complete len:375 (+),score=47.00 TRINITY_DN11119_c0_g1_i5:25-1125(+)
MLNVTWTLELLERSSNSLPNGDLPISPFFAYTSPFNAVKSMLTASGLKSHTVDILSTKKKIFYVSKAQSINTYMCRILVKKNEVEKFLVQSGRYGFFFTEKNHNTEQSVIWMPESSLSDIQVITEKLKEKELSLGIALYQGRTLGIRTKKENEKKVTELLQLTPPLYFKVTGFKDQMTSFEVENFFSQVNVNVTFCFQKEDEKKKEKEIFIKGKEDISGQIGSLMITKIDGLPKRSNVIWGKGKKESNSETVTWGQSVIKGKKGSTKGKTKGGKSEHSTTGKGSKSLQIDNKKKVKPLPPPPISTKMPPIITTNPYSVSQKKAPAPHTEEEEEEQQMDMVVDNIGEKNERSEEENEEEERKRKKSE